MSAGRDERFRRLLRWYPREWRERNAEVFLGTMLDEAEEHGRTEPTAAQQVAAMTYGLGERLDARLALRLAVLALVVSAAQGLVSIWGAVSVAQSGMGWLLQLLTVLLGPGMVTVGALALARQHGLLSQPRALLLAVMSLLAFLGGGLSLGLWSVAFDAADRGVPVTGPATLLPWIVGAAVVLGAAAIALLIEALLQRTPTSRVLGGVLAAVAGVVGAPLIGMTVISSIPAAIAAAGLAVLTSLLGRSRDARPAVSTRQEATGVLPRTRRLARTLAAITAATGSASIVYALSGAQWWPGLLDGTAVMADGITMAVISALPLLGAVGLLVVATARTHPAYTWGPLALVSLSLAAVALAYLEAPAWDGMAPGFAIASALQGAAAAWWLVPRLPGTRHTRLVVALLIGVAYAAVLGVVVVVLLAFVLPLLAAAIAIWTPGRRPSAEINALPSQGAAV